VRRTERWLATARVFLAISALIAVWIDPAELRSIWVYALLAFYIAQGTAVIFLLRARQESTASFRTLVHAADIVWAALICLLTTTQSNPYFLFFLFVLAAAAYRWGLWETVMTGVAADSLLWLESLALHFGVIKPINTWLLDHRLPSINADVIDFEPKRLFMRSVYLVVMSLLLGYLAEQQKKLRAEREEAARMLAMTSIEDGLGGTLTSIIGEMLRLYSAPRALIASRERGGRMSVASVQESRGIATLNWMEPGNAGSGTYLGDPEIKSCYARCENYSGELRFTSLCLNENGTRAGDIPAAFLPGFAEVHPFIEMFAISFSLGPELDGRLFLLEPQLASSPEEELRFIQDLVKRIGPAVYNVYLLRRLRRRAGALERARLIRDLHDGAVQSLIGVEMQVDVLRRSHPMTQDLGAELERIQMLLREEVAKLRELMQQMKSVDIDGHKLPGFLRDTVQRFQREPGINAHFVMDEDEKEILLPQPVCRELARIAQEALVNVRKHSGARQVLVHLLRAQGAWELVIEDDGAGFPFEGRVSQPQLDESSRAPAVIRERVRLIQGELTIESRPGRGARVEVRVAEPQPATNG
jgi:signal transduction histidine kinase